MAARFCLPVGRLSPGQSRDPARFEADEARFEGALEFAVLDAAGDEEPFRVAIVCDVDRRGRRLQVHAAIRGTARSQCHRCLESFDRDVRSGFDLILQWGGPELGEEVVTIAETETEYDLTPHVREAVIIDEPIRLVCRDDCRGLCAQCGSNLNDGACGCVPPADPRWNALKELDRKSGAGP